MQFDNAALTVILVFLNVIFFFSAFAGLLFASIAARDMLTAKHAKKDADKLFAELATRDSQLREKIARADLCCKINGHQHE